MITDFIDEVREDRAAIASNMHRLPEAMQTKLSSDEFIDDALSEFNGLDRDGNGVLTPDELFPIVEDLLGFSSWAISLEHCYQLADVFDDNGDGVISAEEFVELVKFMAVANHRIVHSSEPQAQLSIEGAKVGAGGAGADHDANTVVSSASTLTKATKGGQSVHFSAVGAGDDAGGSGGGDVRSKTSQQDSKQVQAVDAFLADSYANILGVSVEDYESVASGWSSLSHHELNITKQVKAFFDAHGITDDADATVAKWRGKEGEQGAALYIALPRSTPLRYATLPSLRVSSLFLPSTLI